MATRKYKSINIDPVLHEKLKECAEKLSEEHGFQISQSKAISILLYRFFNGTSSYDKPAPENPHVTAAKEKITEAWSDAKDREVMPAAKAVEYKYHTPKKDGTFPKLKDSFCKIHGIPLDSRGKCLQKECKYA
jgi:hypothetical protein